MVAPGSAIGAKWHRATPSGVLMGEASWTNPTHHTPRSAETPPCHHERPSTSGSLYTEGIPTSLRLTVWHRPTSNVSGLHQTPRIAQFETYTLSISRPRMHYSLWEFDLTANKDEHYGNTHTDIATVKQEIEEVKTLIAEKQVASLRWTIGTGIGIAAVVIAAIKFLG